MFRQIVIPQNTQLLLQIPKEFVGQQVEVIAFTLKNEEGKTIKKSTDKEIADFYRSINVKVGKDYKFNREEAHER